MDLKQTFQNLVDVVLSHKILAISILATIGFLGYFFVEIETVYNGHKYFINFLGTCVAIAVTVAGWFYNAKKARDLQRKQLAISLLNDNRHQSAWVDAKSAVWLKIHNEDFGPKDWTNLLQKGFHKDKLLSEGSDEEILWNQLRIVMNYFEFVAMAVNCNAANKYIIQQSWSIFYRILYVNLIDGINQVRSDDEQPGAWINFICLSQDFHPDLKPDEAKPSNESSLNKS